MHTREISRVTAESVTKLNDGQMTPENAKAISDLCRTEISNWRAQLEYARHTGRIASIPDLEELKSVSRKAA